MTNIPISILLLLTSLQSAQGPADPAAEVPTARATSNSVAISVDDGPFVEGAWHLNPDVNPDVFMIGSRLPYGTKKIAFKSDVDTISFDVQAGNEYDFVFILNEDTPCHLKILARPDPEVWNRNVLIPAGIILMAIGVFVVARWKTLKPEPLLRFGLAAPVTFWGMTFISASVRGNYDHVSNVISELGEIGSPAAIVTSLLMFLTSAFCILFSVGFFKASKQMGISVIPAVLTLSMPVTMFWAALFPLKNDLHGVLGPIPLALNLGAVLAFVVWRKHSSLTNIRRWSLVSFLIMMLLFLIFAELADYEGLIQRFWYTGWSLWSITLSLGFLKQLDAESDQHEANFG